jgi:hypothetical protein
MKTSTIYLDGKEIINEATKLIIYGEDGIIEYKNADGEALREQFMQGEVSIKTTTKNKETLIFKFEAMSGVSSGDFHYRQYSMFYFRDITCRIYRNNEQVEELTGWKAYQQLQRQHRIEDVELYNLPGFKM